MTSGGSNFNDFPENQLTIDFAYLFEAYYGRTLPYHRSPFPDIIWGTAFLRVPPQLHRW